MPNTNTCFSPFQVLENEWMTNFYHQNKLSLVHFWHLKIAQKLSVAGVKKYWKEDVCRLFTLDSIFLTPEKVKEENIRLYFGQASFLVLWGNCVSFVTVFGSAYFCFAKRKSKAIPNLKRWENRAVFYTCLTQMIVFIARGHFSCASLFYYFITYVWNNRHLCLQWNRTFP